MALTLFPGILLIAVFFEVGLPVYIAFSHALIVHADPYSHAVSIKDMKYSLPSLAFFYSRSRCKTRNCFSCV